MSALLCLSSPKRLRETALRRSLTPMPPSKSAAATLLQSTAVWLSSEDLQYPSVVDMCQTLQGLELVFVAVYQKALKLLYVDQLLERMKAEFVIHYDPQASLRYPGLP